MESRSNISDIHGTCQGRSKCISTISKQHLEKCDGKSNYVHVDYICVPGISEGRGLEER